MASTLTRLFLLFALGAICAPLAEQARASEIDYSLYVNDSFPSEKQVLKNMQQSVGPILPVDILPAIHSELQHRAQTLAAALRAVSLQELPFEIDLPVEVHLLEGATPNAYMSIAQDPKKGQKIMTFVTTGAIRSTLALEELPGSSASKRPQPDWGFNLLTADLAHEVAHSIDLLDPNGLERKRKRSMPSQAIEIRTDILGMRLLREIGKSDLLMVDSQRIYMLSQPKGGKKRKKGIFEKSVDRYLSTHPEDNVRMSAQRQASALMDSALGDIVDPHPSPQRPHAQSETIYQELHQLESGQPLMSKPTNAKVQHSMAESHIQDIRTLIHQLTADRARTPFSEKELKDLASELKRFREEASSLIRPFTASEQTAYFGLITDLFDKILSNQGLLPDSISSGKDNSLSLPLHRGDSSGKVLLADLSRFQNAIRTQLRKSHQGALDTWSSIRIAFNVDDNNSVDSYLGPELTETILDTIRTHNLHQDINLQEVIRPLIGDSDDFAELFIKSVWPQLTEAEKVRVYLTTGNLFDHQDTDGTPVWPPFKYFADPNLKGQEYRADLNPQQTAKKGAEAPERVLAQELWQNRGLYGTLDFFSLNATTWEEVFHTLDIPIEDGYRQLREATQTFTSSRQYEKLLQSPDVRTLIEARLDSQRRSDFGSYIRWADQATIDKVLSPAHAPALERLKQVLIHEESIEPHRLHEPHKTAVRELIHAHSSNSARRLSVDDIYRRISDLLGRKPSDPKLTSKDLKPFYRILLEEISQSQLPALQQRSLLREIFGATLSQSNRINRGWFEQIDEPNLIDAIVSTLIKKGVYRSASEFLEKVAYDEKNHDFSYKTKSKTLLVVTSLHKKLQPELKKSLSAKGGTPKEAILSATRLLVSPFNNIQWKDILQAQEFDEIETKAWGLPTDALIESNEWKEIKHTILNALEQTHLDFDTRFTVWRELTQSGVPDGSDAFFEKHLLPHVKDRGILESILKDRRLRSQSLTIKVAESLLAPSVRYFRNRKATASDIRHLLDRLEELVPVRSLERDASIERMLWTANVNSRVALDFAQARKASAWRGGNPHFVRIASGSGSFLNTLSKADRIEFVRYVSEQGRIQMSPSLERSFRKSAKAQFKEQSAKNPRVRLLGLESFINLTRQQLHQYVQDAQPIERISPIEMMLTPNGESLLRSRKQIQSLILDLVGYAPDTTNSKMITAYLEALPIEHRSSVFGYMLAHKSKGDIQLGPLFQMFRTVGIKTAQLGSLLELFGEQSQVLAKLKDGADPMDKADIWRILETELPRDQYAKIESIDEILGSASIKTVVKATLKNGEKAVFMVRSPRIEGQIRGNLWRVLISAAAR